jgi:hypothetical protein
LYTLDRYLTTDANDDADETEGRRYNLGFGARGRWCCVFDMVIDAWLFAELRPIREETAASITERPGGTTIALAPCLAIAE